MTPLRPTGLEDHTSPAREGPSRGLHSRRDLLKWALMGAAALPFSGAPRYRQRLECPTFEELQEDTEILNHNIAVLVGEEQRRVRTCISKQEEDLRLFIGEELEYVLDENEHNREKIQQVRLLLASIMYRKKKDMLEFCPRPPFVVARIPRKTYEEEMRSIAAGQLSHKDIQMEGVMESIIGSKQGWVYFPVKRKEPEQKGRLI
jgi:hypothetical protein